MQTLKFIYYNQEKKNINARLRASIARPPFYWPRYLLDNQVLQGKGTGRQGGNAVHRGITAVSIIAAVIPALKHNSNMCAVPRAVLCRQSGVTLIGGHPVAGVQWAGVASVSIVGLGRISDNADPAAVQVDMVQYAGVNHSTINACRAGRDIPQAAGAFTP
jgi:hypothetical protein